MMTPCVNKLDPRPEHANSGSHHTRPDKRPTVHGDYPERPLLASRLSEVMQTLSGPQSSDRGLAALSFATLPARFASGSSGQAATTVDGLCSLSRSVPRG